MFEQVFVENSARTRRPLAVTLSFAGQVALIGLTVLAPLLRTEVIMPSRLMRIVTAPQNRGTPQRTPERTLATAPAHPATAPRLIFSSPVFREPGRVPDRILLADDSAPPVLTPGAAGPAIGGSPNGVPYGLGTDSAQIAKLPPPKPAPPPAPASRAPLRVGGKVQAAKLIHQVMPAYPPLAKQARISGLVRLEAIIARGGMVESLRVISGHPLLVEAAVDAVRQWVYQPTLLNGDPVEVLTQIDVFFKLAE
jgi:periplasmic protein TonB